MTSTVDLLFHVSSPKANNILRGLTEATNRSGCRWSIFLTDQAVKLVLEPWFAAATTNSERVVVCAASWEQFTDSPSCPVESGSQTTNSEMVGNATRVVSL